MTTAIVTYSRGWPALAVVRSLGRRGVRVVCGDSVGCVPSFFSRHCDRSFRYPDPKQDTEGFLAALEEQVRLERERGEQDIVLMPVHAETYVIAAHRERFEALGVLMTLPSSEQIEITRDKGSLAELAESLGLLIPTTHRFSSMEAVFEAAPRMSYPAFVKIRGSAAGIGIQKVSDAEELVRVYREMVEGYELEPAEYPLVQEFVAGDDYCVSALFDHGRPVAVHTYHNIRQFPRTTGAGVLRETVEAPAAETMALRLLEHLEWHGLAQLDFRWDDDGEPYLIEVNPRFFGGLPQAIAAGVDHPWMALQLALGQKVETPEIDPTIRTETPVLGVLASVSALREGKGLRETFAPHRGTQSDVLSWDDPWPVLGVLFPVGVFLKHGTLSPAVVLSEATKKVGPAVRKGFRGHLKPSWKTLVATGLVFLLSLLVGTFADGSMVAWLFSLPGLISDGIFSSAATPAYALFHILNFCFLYTLAALGLKAREEVQAAL